MNKAHRFLCLLLAFSLFLLPGFSAAAADKDADTGRSFKMHPDSGRKTTAEDINAFLAGLDTESVESLQVVYETPWGEENLALEMAPTPIDPAGYPALIALIKELRLFDPERRDPLTGRGPCYYLAVTTRQATVKLSLWDSSNKTASGTLGWASLLEIGSVSQPLSQTKENRTYRQLGEKISELPEVIKALEEIERQLDAQQLQSWKQRGRQIMNGPAVSPNPENPPALAVAATEVAEFNLFQDGYWARVTKPEDQQKLLNLINGIESSWSAVPDSSFPETSGGRVLLQLRLQNGEKHEYQTSKEGTALIADGKTYLDQSAVRIFDEALGEILSGYPAGAAWLGIMNCKNVTQMTVNTAGGRRSYSLEGEPEELGKAVCQLRGITLQGGSSQQVAHGSIPEQLKGKTAECQVELRFQNGIVYQLNFYGERMLTIDSSDMSFSYFYQCERMEGAA